MTGAVVLKHNDGRSRGEGFVLLRAGNATLGRSGGANTNTNDNDNNGGSGGGDRGGDEGEGDPDAEGDSKRRDRSPSAQELTPSDISDLAVARDRARIGQRYIDVHASRTALFRALLPYVPALPGLPVQSPALAQDDLACQVRITGLSFDLRDEDVLREIGGANGVVQASVVIATAADGRPLGEAYFACASPAEALAAKNSLNRRDLAGRCIEVLTGTEYRCVTIGGVAFFVCLFFVCFFFFFVFVCFNMYLCDLDKKSVYF